MERGGGSGKLEITVSHANGARVVRLKGEFDLAGVPAFEHELDREPGPHEGTVVLDMRGLTFLDSSGLRAVQLPAARASVKRRGGPLADPRVAHRHQVFLYPNRGAGQVAIDAPAIRGESTATL